MSSDDTLKARRPKRRIALPVNPHVLRELESRDSTWRVRLWRLLALSLAVLAYGLLLAFMASNDVGPGFWHEFFASRFSKGFVACSVLYFAGVLSLIPCIDKRGALSRVLALAALGAIVFGAFGVCVYLDHFKWKLQML